MYCLGLAILLITIGTACAGTCCTFNYPYGIQYHTSSGNDQVYVRFYGEMMYLWRLTPNVEKMVNVTAKIGDRYSSGTCAPSLDMTALVDRFYCRSDMQWEREELTISIWSGTVFDAYKYTGTDADGNTVIKIFSRDNCGFLKHQRKRASDGVVDQEVLARIVFTPLPLDIQLDCHFL